jgi:hypothetical protein
VTGDVDTGTRAELTEALEVHCVERAVGVLEARGGAAHVVCPRPGAAWRVVSLLGLQRQWLVHQDLEDAVAKCTARQ